MEKKSESLEEMWMHLHIVSLKGISVNTTCFELMLNYFADCELSPPFNFSGCHLLLLVALYSIRTI